MSEIDWRDHARKWEGRAKTARREAERYKRELEIARAKELEWRTAFNALRSSLEGRLDRVTKALESWEQV